jgi:putative aldouronate transport system permease protein
MKRNDNAIRHTKGEDAFNAFNVCLLLLVTLCMLYPMLHVIFSSLSNGALLMKHKGLLWRPQGFSLAAYRAVARSPMIPLGYRNTVFVVVAGTALNILMTALGAFFVSRKDQTAAKYVMLFFLFTMFFSGGMIPAYLNVNSLGLYDSLWALILPGLVSTYNLIILRTAFQAIPESLEESAKLDGANHFQILTRIYLPLSTTVIAVLVLYYGVGHWNAWFDAMLYIRDRNLYPLQLIMREVLISNDVSQMYNAGVDVDMVAPTVQYAVIVATTLPILCIYPFLQKYFVKGVLIGSVKE